MAGVLSMLLESARKTQAAMRADNLECFKREHGWGVRAIVESEALPDGAFELEFAVDGAEEPAAIDDLGDSLFAALLLPAMVAGEPLSVDVPVSSRLLRRAGDIMAIYAAWADLSPVAIKASSTARPTGRGKTAQFFSGGVDSFFSLLEHPEDFGGADPTTRLVYINGFDIPLGNESLHGAVDSIRRVAATAECGVTIVTTNLRYLAEPMIDWGLYHGSMLASVALLLSGSVSRCVIPASHAYQFLGPWGTHPLLDPMWSTERLEIVHDGCEATREQKIDVVSAAQLAQRELRVCLQPINGVRVFNCGHCRKCVLTMLTLRLHGRLDVMETFPELELEDIEQLSARALQSLSRLTATPQDRRLVDAIRQARRKAVRREARERRSATLRSRWSRRSARRRASARDRDNVAFLKWRATFWRVAQEHTSSDSRDPQNAFLRSPERLLAQRRSPAPASTRDPS